MLLSELKKKISSIYRDCYSYQDSGYIVETKVGRAARKQRITFETRYLKPAFFMLEWQTDPWLEGSSKTNIIKANESGIFIKKASGKTSTAENIEQGLKRLSGISRRVSIEIPSLLLNFSQGALDYEYDNFGTGSCSEIDLYFFECKSTSLFRYVEVEKDRMLLRRIEEHKDVDATLLLPEDMLSKVQKDLTLAGANPSNVLTSYQCISEIFYSSVILNAPISKSIFD